MWFTYLDAISGQEHDALVELQDSQEDRNKLVSLQLVQAAFFEEHIRLVQQQNGVPASAHLENHVELVFDMARLDSEVTGRHPIQWCFHLFCDALCCESLTYSRRTAEEQDDAFAFTFDHIVKSRSVITLTLGESKDEFS